MYYITGDTHGRFEHVVDFCSQNKTAKSDVLIILGDAGINFWGGHGDNNKKRLLQSLPITIFAIHGNHEIRPQNLECYVEVRFAGGIVYQEEKYPNILFAKDGEVYNFAGNSVLVVGGAYSVDKEVRLARGYKWWSDEQPDDTIKRRVESQLETCDWQVDIVLTHTVPFKYEPVEVFLPFVIQSKVDRTTEYWLQTLEEQLQYKKWYAGHFHTEKIDNKLEFLYQTIKPFMGDKL